MYIQDQTNFSTDKNAVVPSIRSAFFRDGMLASTMIETQAGWQQADMLRAGDRVHTFDGGLRQVVRVERRFFDIASDADAPEFLIHVPGGTLSSCSDAVFMPDQRVLLETPALEDMLGVPSALARIGDLCGLLGISLVRPAGMQQAVRPVLEDEEILWANTGLMCHFGAIGVDGRPATSPFFTELDADQARLSVHSQAQENSNVVSFLAA